MFYSAVLEEDIQKTSSNKTNKQIDKQQCLEIDSSKWWRTSRWAKYVFRQLSIRVFKNLDILFVKNTFLATDDEFKQKKSVMESKTP